MNIAAIIISAFAIVISMVSAVLTFVSMRKLERLNSNQNHLVNRVANAQRRTQRYG